MSQGRRECCYAIIWSKAWAKASWRGTSVSAGGPSTTGMRRARWTEIWTAPATYRPRPPAKPAVRFETPAGFQGHSKQHKGSPAIPGRFRRNCQADFVTVDSPKSLRPRPLSELTGVRRHPTRYHAAMETGTPKLIEKAEGLLDDALNLTGVLLAAVAGDSDTRGM